MSNKVGILSLVFLSLLMTNCGPGEPANNEVSETVKPQSAVLRVMIWDLTESNPIHSKAEIWMEGIGSWWIRRAFDVGDSVKMLGKHQVGGKRQFFFYPESRNGREIIIPFMMTDKMNPEGNVRDSLSITFSDGEIEVVGLPLEAATGNVSMNFKRK